MPKLQLVPPKKKTVVESIIDQIIALIKDGSLQPGDKLPPERQLIDMLHVSRSSVREALQALAAMDLIESRAGDGTFVKDLKPLFSLNLDASMLSNALLQQMHLQLNQARRVLETGIASIAANEIDEKSRRAISDALRVYEAGAAELSEERGWPGHDRIHLSIAEATGNPILLQLLESLLVHIPQSLRRRSLLNGDPNQVSRRMAEELEIHRRLCQAVIQGNSTEACLWIERHVEHEEKLINSYNSDTLAGETS